MSLPGSAPPVGLAAMHQQQLQVRVYLCNCVHVCVCLDLCVYVCARLRLCVYFCVPERVRVVFARA